MITPPSTDLDPTQQVLSIMAALRSPEGCPWDREQNHQSLRWHAVEEVYEMIDAIEADDDVELQEELGDLLLQVVFHCQLAKEREVFDFESVCQRLAAKLVRRHPHVFGDVKVVDVDQVWKNWERIKREEKAGTQHARGSALDGVPRHLPALMRAQKLFKKACKANLIPTDTAPLGHTATDSEITQIELSQTLFELARNCQKRGCSAEDLLREECNRQEELWRKKESGPSSQK